MSSVWNILFFELIVDSHMSHRGNLALLKYYVRQTISNIYELCYNYFFVHKFMVKFTNPYAIEHIV